MKKTFTTLFALFLLTSVTLQAQNLFTENFENPDSVVSSGTPGWSVSNSVQSSGFFSDSTSLIGTDTSTITTIPFSTLGSYNVKLNFNHIVYGDFFYCRVLVSINNGATWNQLGGNEYLGNALSFNFGDNFTSNDYSDWISPQPCFNSNPLNNGLFKSELFDLSSICANESNVLVKFETSNDTSFSCTLPSPFRGSSWFIDDVIVTGQPISLTSTDECNNDGTASVMPFFGTAPHTYVWSNGLTTPNLTNLMAGTYTVTVTDNLGVSISDSVVINPPFQVFTSINQPQCPAQQVGVASVFAFGGTAPFTYLWSTGETTQTVSPLTIGTYTATVTDAIGCVATENITIECASNAFISSTASSCANANGTATVDSVSNSTPPYSYSWNTNPIQTTQTASGLNGNSLAGVSITDANGDTYSGFIVIPYTDTVNVNSTFTPSQCNIATGAAVATASGGTAPYTYSWNTNPPQSTATANFLSAQGYSVIATDANGCTGNDFVIIPNVNTMLVNFSLAQQTLCGQNTGAASVNVSGGTPPYTYSWNTTPVQTTASASNLSYGNHAVTVTDNAGCSIVKNVFIGSINSLNITVTYPNTSCVCVDPIVSVTGGVAPYNYLWDDGTSNQTSSCFDEGYHYVRVTDAAGCQQIQSFYVTFSANCYITVNGKVFADLNKNCMQDAGEYGIANTQVSLSDAGSTKFTNTDNNGNYSFYVLNDTFQLSHNPSNNWFANCPTAPASYTVIAPAGSINTFDFADTAANYFDDAAVLYCSISGRTRGFNSSYNVSIRNDGTNQLSGNVSAIHDPILTYVNSIPLVNTYTAATNTGMWNYTALNPGESRLYSLTTLIPATTPLGTLFTNTSNVSPVASDVDLSNNNCATSANVNGSYDPNDKVAWPPNDMDAADLWHTYVINFQNTGTSPAVRVIIEDTLDANLDASSIANIVASHPYSIDDSQLPFIRFIFDNINLPDSNMNEPESHGFIAFRIKRNNAVPTGTQISNTAYIYFDFNSPIVTNTVVNTIVMTGINENSILSNVTVYPNPSTGMVYLDYDINTRDIKELQIFNALNQLIYTEKFSVMKGKIILDLNTFSSGIYNYRIVSNSSLLSSGKISLVK